MVERSIVARMSEILGVLAEVALVASQVPPQGGSIIALETERDRGIGSSVFPFPYQSAHTTYRSLIYAAGERAETIRWCLDAAPFPHVMSVSELARSAAEAAATSHWVSRTDIDGETRLRRMLGLWEISGRQQGKLRAKLGMATGLPLPTDAALAWAKEKDLPPSPCRTALTYCSKQVLVQERLITVS